MVYQRDKYKIERELKRIEYEKEQIANSECTFTPNILGPLPTYDNERYYCKYFWKAGVKIYMIDPKKQT